MLEIFLKASGGDDRNAPKSWGHRSILQFHKQRNHKRWTPEEDASNFRGTERKCTTCGGGEFFIIILIGKNFLPSSAPDVLP